MAATEQDAALDSAVQALRSRAQQGSLLQVDCPLCGAAKLTWAYRFERPEFRFGTLVCQGCKIVFDVMPRRIA